MTTKNTSPKKAAKPKTAETKSSTNLKVAKTAPVVVATKTVVEKSAKKSKKKLFKLVLVLAGIAAAGASVWFLVIG